MRIPNSSYKILGHIPDISGHGNHGVIHNSAYAEGSGVNEDGSYQFDGVDDFVTIPTVTGGKQVLMKVNWQSVVGAVTLYDQRLNISDYEFAIYNGNRDLDDNPVPAYQGRNNGQIYIDGITVAKFSNGYTSMVFYKLILYPKTISLLEINFLKNLMEKDEIIDLNNPIFIKNE